MLRPRYRPRLRAPIACAAVSAFALVFSLELGFSPGWTNVAFAQDRDSLRLVADVGVGTDVTNQILYEQTFDSTAFTGRLTTSDGETRVLALARANLLGLSGRTSYAIGTDLRAGPLLFRNLAHAGVGRVVNRRLRVSLDAEHDYRRDSSFDQKREDTRFGTLLAGRWSDVVTGWGGRAFHRFETQRSAADGVQLFPDFDYQAFGVDVDRLLGVAGSASLSYALAFRSFPDSAVRDYHEHSFGLNGLVRLSDEFTLDVWSDGSRRSAREAAAVGDRFWQGDLEARLTGQGGGPIEAGARARIRATGYDEPTTSFFDSRFFRYAAFARYRPSPEVAIEVRPEVEFARTPDFGGLPETSSNEDRITVAGEEFDQVSLRTEYERFARASWLTLGVAAGTRNYLVGTRSPDNLSARSDYWFAELVGFYDLRISSRHRFVVSADWLSEFHDLSSDDVHSLFLSAEVRTRL
ncbi:MAG: hypothetical protein ACREOU_07660 [Candidatus Eiseniibacteriota bacterium]